MTIKALVESRVVAAMLKAGLPEDMPAAVGPATRPEFGDYQVNGVMGAAKRQRTNPRQLAEAVVAALEVDDIASCVEIAGPGFINIRLKDGWLSARLAKALGDERLGVAPAQVAQTVVVDYSGPNLAKEMHVGNLRSTTIGDAVVRALEFCGHRVIRHNHVGDWGTQFGMLIAYLEQLEHQQADVSVELADLEGFYRDAKERFDRDEAFATVAREYVVKLQGGDAQVHQIWQQFIDISLEHCDAVYEKLGVSLRRQDVRGESAYNDALPGIIDALDAASLLTESQGAQCVFLDGFKGRDDEPLPTIVQKSDGGYLYATTDLAALRYRTDVLGADRLLYFVDARQSLHLKQIFAVARAAGFAPEHLSLEYLPFGTMKAKDGKPFRTRAGGTVKLMDLLQEAEQRAFDLVSQRSSELPEEQRRQIAQVVGIGAVKYADLSLNRTTDYVFDWDRMLAFDGNTAPYMQYSYARIRSIFRRGGLEGVPQDAQILLNEPAERKLALKLAQLDETLESVVRECYPNLLCNYLYELAEAFMQFYEFCPVLKSEEPARTSRLMLCLLTGQTMQTGLGLLGIETLEQM